MSDNCKVFLLPSPPSFFLLLPLCLFHEGKMVMKLVTMSSDCVGFVLGHGLRELLITAFVLGRSEESVNFLQFCPQKRSLQGSCYFYYLGAAHRPSKVVRGAKRRLGLYATSPPPFLLAGMQRCCTHRLPSGRHPRDRKSVV